MRVGAPSIKNWLSAMEKGGGVRLGEGRRWGAWKWKERGEVEGARTLALVAPAASSRQTVARRAMDGVLQDIPVVPEPPEVVRAVCEGPWGARGKENE